MCRACVCDVFKRVWFDCVLLCDGVWSVVCVGLCVRVCFLFTCLRELWFRMCWCVLFVVVVCVCVYVLACFLCDVLYDVVWFVFLLFLHVLFVWVFCSYICVMCL